MRQYFLTVVVVLMATGLQAQEIDVAITAETESNIATSNMATDEHVRADSQMSLLIDGAQNEHLLTVAASIDIETAPGVCLVIGDMLADFCKNKPGDASCL